VKKPFDEEHDYFSRALAFNKQFHMEREYNERILVRANLNIDDGLAESLVGMMADDTEDFTLDPARYDAYRSRPLFSFAANDTVYTKTVADFIAEYNGKLLRKKIGKINELTSFIRNIVCDEFTYRHGVELGVTSTRKFILDKKKYRMRVLLWHYERDILHIPDGAEPGEKERRKAARYVEIKDEVAVTADLSALRLSIKKDISSNGD
jgi:hypothetical protein